VQCGAAAFAFTGTPEQEEAGTVDNDDLLLEDLTRGNSGRNMPTGAAVRPGSAIRTSCVSWAVSLAANS
jgi:hypothetical protein